MQTKFQLGDVLKDVVTGYEGVVMVVAFYYTGCTHYTLQPRKLNKDGDERDWKGFDETRLVVSGKRVELPGLAARRAAKPAGSGPFPEVPKL